MILVHYLYKNNVNVFILTHGTLNYTGVATVSESVTALMF